MLRRARLAVISLDGVRAVNAARRTLKAGAGAPSFRTGGEGRSKLSMPRNRPRGSLTQNFLAPEKLDYFKFVNIHAVNCYAKCRLTPGRAVAQSLKEGCRKLPLSRRSRRRMLAAGSDGFPSFAHATPAAEVAPSVGL